MTGSFDQPGAPLLTAVAEAGDSVAAVAASIAHEPAFRREDTIDDLIEFIRARLAEDKATALATTGAVPSSPPTWRTRRLKKPDVRERPCTVYGHGVGGWLVLGECVAEADADHIVRQSPTRAAAEADAKLFALETVARWLHDTPGDPVIFVVRVTLLALAHPYAAHEDYRAEWALDT